MTGTRIFGLLILAIVAEFLSIFLGRYFGLSQFAAVGIGLIPAMLLAFPVIRHWYGGRLSFNVWLLIVAGIISAGTLIHLVIGFASKAAGFR